MKSLDLDACLAYQQIFYNEEAGAYSPYECIAEPGSYYPLALSGEIGSLLNAYCKRDRSLNDYSEVVEDEAADTFLYLIMTAKIVKPDAPEILDGIREDWAKPPETINDDAELMAVSCSLINRVAQLNNNETDAYTATGFREMFGLVKSISIYVTGKDWQSLIDSTHAKYIDMRSKPDFYTPDLRSKGGGYQNFGLLLEWIANYEAELPRKRVEFLGRLAIIQGLQSNFVSTQG